MFWCEGGLGVAGGEGSGRGGCGGGWVRIPRRLRGRGAVLSRSPNVAGGGGGGGKGRPGGRVLRGRPRRARRLWQSLAHPPAHFTGCDLIPRRGNNFLINV